MPRSASSGAAARQTASASGLPSPASWPWASTSPPTSVSTTRSQCSCLRRAGQPVGDGGRAARRVEQQDGLAEVAGHVRLGEAKAAGPGGVRAGEGGVRVQRLRRGQLVDAPRTGQRVDRPALPGQPADDRRRAERLRQLGDDERADDVTAAADADGEDPLGGGERREHGRNR